MHKQPYLRVLAATVLIGLVWCGNGLATGLFSGVDVEKPNPVFTLDAGRITAKFIPRAKSTSVSMEFAVLSGGTLDAVKGVDFIAVDRPEVDIKNFKSAAFEIDIRDVTPGGVAALAIRSDFFSMSTAFYIFNPNLEKPWIRDGQKENRLTTGRIRELVIRVKDGGDRDADGAINGRIRLVGGPRDSFWGYALGTLFIRFFGIFFVLCLLMIGMFASGWVFKRLDRQRERGASAQSESAPGVTDTPAPARAAESAPAVPETVAAAIAAALYLSDPARHKTTPAFNATEQVEQGTAWSQSGRCRIMQERLVVFRQAGKNRN